MTLQARRKVGKMKLAKVKAIAAHFWLHFSSNGPLAELDRADTRAVCSSAKSWEEAHCLAGR
jgi:hypothetical protein